MSTLWKNTAAKGAALVGAAAAGWLSYESYKGASPIWQQKAARFSDRQDYVDIRNDFGRYTGQPTMESWADKVRRTALYGPFGLRTFTNNIATNVGGFVNDVILKNIHFLALATAGLYATGFKPHRIITEPFNFFKKYIPDTINWDRPKGLVRRSFRGIGHGIVKAIGVGVRNPVISGVVALLGLLGLARFGQVYNGEEQANLFRDFTNVNNDYK